MGVVGICEVRCCSWHSRLGDELLRSVRIRGEGWGGCADRILADTEKRKGLHKKGEGQNRWQSFRRIWNTPSADTR